MIDWPSALVSAVFLYVHGMWLGVILRTRYLQAHGRLLPPCEHEKWETIGPGEWVCTNLACRKRRSGGYPK